MRLVALLALLPLAFVGWLCFEWNLAAQVVDIFVDFPEKTMFAGAILLGTAIILRGNRRKHLPPTVDA